jgi:hypothetical protein
MTDNAKLNVLVTVSKDIIADGCGCDRWCETEEGVKYGCSCYDDAERIVKLTVDTIWDGGEPANG